MNNENKENKNVDITKESVVTCVEWFHGYGGNALGLKRAIPGLRSIAVCERDAFVVANMVSKMEKGLLDAVPIWTDVTDFPCEPFGYQQLDFFAAPYPCQGFSHAGKRLGTEDHRHLWPYCRKFIRAVRPGCVWLENVEGHVTLGLSTVLADLEEDGYTAAWGIFSASEVGAPHQRKRVFILAHRSHDGLPGSAVQDRISERDFPQPALERSNIPVVRGRFEGGGEHPGTGESHTGWELDNPLQRGCECLGQMGAGREAVDVAGEAGNVWPSRPGERQYAWEPPRVVPGPNIRPGKSWDEFGVGDSTESRPSHEFQAGGHNVSSRPVGEPSQKENGANIQPFGQTQPQMGGNVDGPAAGLDFPGCTGLSDSELEEIYGWMVKGTNRTDELRMCGNGVVPQTAERAFRVLYAELLEQQRVDDLVRRSVEDI